MLRKEFGSLIAARFGIYAAKEMLGHADIGQPPSIIWNLRKSPWSNWATFCRFDGAVGFVHLFRRHRRALHAGLDALQHRGRKGAVGPRAPGHYRPVKLLRVHSARVCAALAGSAFADKFRRLGYDLHPAGFEMVNATGHTQFIFFHGLAQDWRGGFEFFDVEENILADRIVQKAAGLADRGFHGGLQGLDQRGNVAGKRRAFFHGLDSGVHGSAGFVAEHEDQRNSEDSHAIFETGDGILVCEIARDAAYEKIAAPCIKGVFGSDS